LLEPIVVDAPTIFPNACAQCHGQTGPLVDTHVENRFGDRVYLCASCIRIDAIALGLVKGKRHSELLTQMRTAAEDSRQAEAARALADEARTALAIEERTSGQLRDELVAAHQRIDQLENAIRTEAEASLAVVAAGASS
jgi:hypothetical protein